VKCLAEFKLRNDYSNIFPISNTLYSNVSQSVELNFNLAKVRLNESEINYLHCGAHCYIIYLKM